MSSRIRTLEPDFWDHPRVCVMPIFTRCLLVYCMTRLADDEGRFEIYPPAIAERFLAKADEQTVADIETAFDQAEDAGLLQRYGSAREFAWFPGWFEHQNIPLGRRSESSLPSPPCNNGEVTSWVETEAVREAMAKATGRELQQVRSDDAVRWFINNQSPERIQTINAPSTKRKPDGTGQDGTGLELPSVPSATTDSTPIPKLKAETAKQRKQRKIEEEQQLLSEFDEEEQELIDDLMVAADEELERKNPNSRGTTMGGRVTRLNSLVAIANEVDDPEAFRSGLRIASEKRIGDPRYVRAVALNKSRGGA